MSQYSHTGYAVYTQIIIARVVDRDFVISILGALLFGEPVNFPLAHECECVVARSLTVGGVRSVSTGRLKVDTLSSDRLLVCGWGPNLCVHANPTFKSCL